MGRVDSIHLPPQIDSAAQRRLAAACVIQWLAATEPPRHESAAVPPAALATRLRRRAPSLVGGGRGRVGRYKTHHGGLHPRPPLRGNLPGPVAGHPTYGRRPGHRTAIARRGAGGEGPGGGFPGPFVLFSFGGGHGGREAACSRLAPAAAPSGRFRFAAGFPAGSSLASPGASIYVRGVVCVRAATPIRSPTPDNVLVFSCCCWLLCRCRSRGAEARCAGLRVPAATEVCAVGLCVLAALCVSLLFGMSLWLPHAP